MVIYNKSFMAVTSIKTGTKRLILVPRDLPRTINDIMLQAKKKMNRNGRAGENQLRGRIKNNRKAIIPAERVRISDCFAKTAFELFI
jgi:hypothetical protein